MCAFRVPVERSENAWSMDKDGVLCTVKDKDSTETYDLDFTDALPTSETISTGTITPNGVTVNSSSIITGDGGSNTGVRVSVTGTDGSIKVALVTSGSKTLVKYFRFKGAPVASPLPDYR